VSRRRLQRGSAKAQRHALPSAGAERAPLAIVREAPRVERLAYTRTQAAQALGIGRSTFIRRVLPFVETIEIGSGARLVPVDELQRFVAERRREARAARGPSARPGRKVGLPHEVIARIRAEHANGKSLREIADGLNADEVQTSQAGQWWPSTVRSILHRHVFNSDPVRTSADDN
jgi:hypothetical protein